MRKNRVTENTLRNTEGLGFGDWRLAIPPLANLPIHQLNLSSPPPLYVKNPPPNRDGSTETSLHFPLSPFRFSLSAGGHHVS